MQTEISGLTTEEVETRKQREQNGTPRRTMTKTTEQIIRDNVFTLFNLLNFSIAVLLFLAKAYSNMLFIAIILANIVIGIVQELKAKKLVDELTLLNRPQVTVLRDGKECSISIEEVVQDDVMILESGRQICSDAVVLSGGLEVNESLLTGESDAVVKEPGDQLLSGSSVISGKCYARVIHAESDNYVEKLAAEVKAEKQTGSELLASMQKVTHFTSFLILPLGILLFLEAVLLRNAPFDTAIVATAAALLGMLPKGLVLLISVSLANGVIRLSKKKILVQNIYSLETLAHIDVLCLDIIAMESSRLHHQKYSSQMSYYAKIHFLDLPLLFISAPTKDTGSCLMDANKINLVYVGTLPSGIRSPDPILRVFSYINDDCWQLYFIGEAAHEGLNAAAERDSQTPA